MTGESHEKAASVEAGAAAEHKTVETCVRRVYRLIDDHIESIGGMDSAAGICGVKRWDLRRALDRDGRYLPIDHAVAIAARMRKHNAGIATQIAAALVFPIDLLVFPRVTIDDAEARRRYENFIRRMPMGDLLVEEALKTP